MGRFVEVADQQQAGFLPACLEDYVDADNPVRIIDAFVDKLDLTELSFARVQLHRPEDLAKHRAPCSSFTYMDSCIS